MQNRPPTWLLYSVTVVGILSNTLLTPNIPDVLRDLGQPEGRAGLLVAAGPLPGVIIAPVVGVLADRYGRRPVLVPCLVVFGLAGIGASQAPDFNTLLLARLLQGFGSAGLINLAVVLIGDHWKGNDRTRMVGRNAAALTTGLAIIPFISGGVAEFANWRWSLAIAALALPLAAVALVVLPDIRPAEPRTLRAQLAGASQAVRSPAIALVLFTVFVLFFVIFGVFLTTYPLHLENEFGLGPAARGAMLSAPAVGSIAAAYNLGRLRRRFSLRIVLVVPSLLIATGATMLGVVEVIPLLVVAAILYGLGDGIVIPALQDLAISAAPTEQRGSMLAAWVSCGRLGQALGPIAAGALFVATSTGTVMIVGGAVFAAVAFAFAIGPLSQPEARSTQPASED